LNIKAFARALLGAIIAITLIAATTRVTPSAEAPSSAGGMRGVPVMFAPKTLFHTLTSDFFRQPDGTIYVQTGDIPAMWLRDSAAQTLPYVRLAGARPLLRTWIRGVVLREARNINIDPYANAFRSNYRIWERKWEIDSLAYPVLLAWTYYDATHDRELFTASLHGALRRILETYACERAHARCSRYRVPPHSGRADRGPAPEVGLIWSAFRASDDPTRYAYNIPEQMFAATALRDVADLAVRGYHDAALANRATTFAAALSKAIASYGIVNQRACGGPIYAYEVDGRGHAAVFDDANLPSLLGAPLSGPPPVADLTYQRTRACMLSTKNPYYFRGRFATGIGSPHTPRGYVWPLAMIARALTSIDPAEVAGQLAELARSASADGRIHESFDVNDPTRFTRAEFGWANAMYAELLFRAAAGASAQPVAPSFGRSAMLARSISVVDRETALANRAALLRAFDQAVPMDAAFSRGSGA
jgi:meiotically up-regulated gene 157 (Mug157) protein